MPALSALANRTASSEPEAETVCFHIAHWPYTRAAWSRSHPIATSVVRRTNFHRVIARSSQYSSPLLSRSSGALVGAGPMQCGLDRSEGQRPIETMATAKGQTPAADRDNRTY